MSKVVIDCKDCCYKCSTVCFQCKYKYEPVEESLKSFFKTDFKLTVIDDKETACKWQGDINANQSRTTHKN